MKHKTALKNRIHASLTTFGHPCPVSDLFGVGGRALLDRLEFEEPWRGDIEASVRLIDELGEEITGIEKDLRATGADHPYVPLLMSVPGAGWILARGGDRRHRPVPEPDQAGRLHRPVPEGVPVRRGSLAKCGPRYLRWALIEAAVHGARHPVYQERYERTARRLGRQRGTKIARVDFARRMAESIWHMLTTEQPFAPAGATQVLAA